MIKKIIIILLLTFSLSGQSLDYLLFGGLVYKSFHNQIVMEDITMPLALMTSHVVVDHYFSEGSLGVDLSEQLAVNGVFSWVGYLLQPTEKRKDEYFYVLLWSSIIPDTILKPLLHANSSHMPPENPIFTLNRSQETLLMGLELISLKYIF